MESLSLGIFDEIVAFHSGFLKKDDKICLNTKF